MNKDNVGEHRVEKVAVVDQEVTNIRDEEALKRMKNYIPVNVWKCFGVESRGGARTFKIGGRRLWKLGK